MRKGGRGRTMRIRRNLRMPGGVYVLQRRKLDRSQLRRTARTSESRKGSGGTGESRKGSQKERRTPRHLYGMQKWRGVHGSGRRKSVRIRRDMRGMQKLPNMQRRGCGRTVQF